MKKFIRSGLCFAAAVIIVAVFAGCSLFERNLDHDYSRIVAEIGKGADAVKITKKELFDTYNRYGYNFVTQNSLTVAEAFEKTLESLINREIEIKIAVETFNQYDDDKTMADWCNFGVLGYLTEYEEKSARKSAFDSLNSSIKTYSEEIITGTSITADDTSSAEENSGAVVYKPYEKYINVNNFVTYNTADYNIANQVFTLDLSSYEEVTDVGSVPDLWLPTIPNDVSVKVAKQALARIIRNLESNEQGFEKLDTYKKGDKEWFLNTKSVKKTDENGKQTEVNLLYGLDDDDLQVINREILRLVTNQEKNLLTGRLEYCYELNIKDYEQFKLYNDRAENPTEFHNFTMQTSAEVATGIAMNAIEQYKAQIRQAITNYNDNTPADMEADLLASGGLTDVYYVPQTVAKNLFTVSHILVGFTDEQKTQYKNINANTDPSFNKEAALETLYGETKSGGKTVYEIYDEIIGSVNAQTNINNKYTTFRDLIYKYNTDTGMQNPTHEYVMSLNKDKNTMIQPFTEASIALKKAEVKSAVSGIVWGDYGAHIIMYTRDLSDFIYTNSAELIGTYFDDTLFAPQTSYGNKTRFDILVENLHRSFTNYEAQAIKDYKTNLQKKLINEGLLKEGQGIVTIHKNVYVYDI